MVLCVLSRGLLCCSTVSARSEQDATLKSHRPRPNSNTEQVLRGGLDHLTVERLKFPGSSLELSPSPHLWSCC